MFKLALASAVVLASCLSAVAQTDLSARVSSLQAQGLFDWGAQSCAAANCHGGPTPGRVNADASRGSEYQWWLENDPHARAALTLSSERSLQMYRHLRIIVDGNIVDQAAYDNCLQCHNPSRIHRVDLSGIPANDGVGCESCHGPSTGWLSSHYQYGWNDAIGTASGKVDTRGLLTRARLCADCHVGSSQRQVNHDMIAAGHPALRFEFASYHNKLPKHWRHAEESPNNPEHQTQLWLAGQIASAEAGLALLEARAEKPSEAWPEFSEYNCGGCHFSLTDRVSQHTRRPGKLPIWGDWQYTGLRLYLQSENPPLAKRLTTLRTHMEQLAPREAIHAKARELRIMLNRFVTAHENELVGKGEIAQRVLSQGLEQQDLDPAASRPTWEEIAQLYLGGVARYRSSQRPLLRNIHSNLVSGQRNRWTLEPDIDPATVRSIQQVLRELGRNGSR